ncbi:sugar transferase, partial [Bacillus toyonensis]
MKRLLDIFISLLLLICFFFIILLVAIIVKTQIGSPILF